MSTTSDISPELHPYLDKIQVRDGRMYFNHGSIIAPIVDSEHIPVIDHDHLPRAEVDNVIVDALGHGHRLLLIGDCGSGKSSALIQIAARLGWPCRRVNLNGETGLSDFVGSWIVQGQSMVYKYGILPTAMRDGHILLLDEIDAAQPEVLFVLQAVLEGASLFLPDTMETIQPHPDFRLVATANSIGNDQGLYVGTKKQNAASLDRWDIVCRVPYPNAPDEEALVLKRTGSPNAGLLVKVFTDLREAVGRGDLSGPFSTRRLMMCATLWVRMQDRDRAIRLALTDRLPEAERNVVHEIVKRYIQ